MFRVIIALGVRDTSVHQLRTMITVSVYDLRFLIGTLSV